MRSVGIQERYYHSCCGSDANVFKANNKQALNLSVGYKHIHTIDESISVKSLNKLYELCLEIVTGGNHEKKQSFFMILTGIFLVVLSVNAFLGPHNIAAGGASGLGIILNSVLKVSPSITVLFLNILVLILAYLYLGVDFFLKSLLGSILFPILLALIPTYKLLNDTLLSVLLGSVIFGLGVSILYRNNASSGGTTIPSMIIKKYFNIDKSLGLLMIDSIIVLFSLFTFGFESFVLASYRLL